MQAKVIILSKTKSATSNIPNEIKAAFGKHSNDISYIKLKKNETYEQALNALLIKRGALGQEHTHLCVIPEFLIVNENFEGIITQYAFPPIEGEEDLTVYMPMLLILENQAGDNIPRTIMNTCFWQRYLKPIELGMLDFDIALKQFDLSLWGSFIPKDLLKKILFENQCEYQGYSHYALIYQILSKGFIQGIPKFFGSANISDVTQKGSTDEKKTLFKKVKEYGEFLAAQKS